MCKHLNLRLLGFSLGTTPVVPNPCFYFLQIIENEAFVILGFLENQENKKLGLRVWTGWDLNPQPTP